MTCESSQTSLRWTTLMLMWQHRALQTRASSLREVGYRVPHPTKRRDTMTWWLKISGGASIDLTKSSVRASYSTRLASLPSRRSRVTISLPTGIHWTPTRLRPRGRARLLNMMTNTYSEEISTSAHNKLMLLMYLSQGKLHWKGVHLTWTPKNWFQITN